MMISRGGGPNIPARVQQAVGQAVTDTLLDAFGMPVHK